MIPIAPTVFWGPMAYAIMGGLAVATVLTLVFLPSLYVAWFRIKKPGPDAGQTMDLGHFGRSEEMKEEDAVELVSTSLQPS